MSRYPLIPAPEVLRFLQSLQSGEVKLECRDATAPCDNSGAVISYYAGNGWEIDVFNDSDDFDYIDHLWDTEGRQWDYDDAGFDRDRFTKATDQRATEIDEHQAAIKHWQDWLEKTGYDKIRSWQPGPPQDQFNPYPITTPGETFYSLWRQECREDSWRIFGFPSKHLKTTHVLTNHPVTLDWPGHKPSTGPS